MKDIIQNRINKITDLNERKLLKSVLIEVYEELTDYNLDMYKKLEKRIYEEIEDTLDKFYIYTCLEYTYNIDKISEFLHPILESDIQDTVYDMEELLSKIKFNEDIVLSTVFMKCNSLQFEEIISMQRTYKGFVKTDSNIYEVTAYLRKNKKYLDEIAELYKIYQSNAKEWVTINCPYAYKFVDVILNSNLPFKTGEKIIEISIDLGEYEKYKVTDVIPLWNVKKIKVSDNTFPMPAKDRINYDHRISLVDFGVNNGYLATEDNSFIYLKRYENDLVIVSSNSDQNSWELIQIESPENNYRKNFRYDLMTNKRNLGFVGRYSSLKSIKLRTKGEMARFLRAYDLSESLQFSDVEVVDGYKKSHKTEDLNSFKDDNIRISKLKKIMVIKFIPSNRDDYLIYDKMSFLVSEIQVMFPEFRCTGELV